MVGEQKSFNKGRVVISKELEAYNRLCSHLDYDNDDYMFNGQYEEDNAVIENALKDYETLNNVFISMRDFKYKPLDPLEIIKEKTVDCYFLSKCKSLDEYNSGCLHLYPQLTKEEYDLLKKVLK